MLKNLIKKVLGMNEQDFMGWLIENGYSELEQEKLSVALSRGLQITQNGLTVQMEGTKHVMLYLGNVKHTDKNYWFCGGLSFKDAMEMIERLRNTKWS